MAGLSDFQLMMADTDTLLRAAQAGDKDALVQLRYRGEMNPPTPGPLSGIARSTTRNMSRPASVPVMALQRPPYLDRGMSRDMERPAGSNSLTNNPLPFMSAINQRPETPPYLGMNLGEESAATPTGPTLPARVKPAYDPIAAIAHGQDAAAPLQTGAAAADADAAAMTPERPAMPPITSMGADEDPEGYQGMIGNLIRELTAGISPDKNRRRALAEAGFAMAASGNPFFFGAVGQGGQAGLKAFREAEAQDMENRVRAATLGGHELTRMEQKRSNKTQEGLEQQRNIETSTHNRATEAEAAARLKETERSNRANEALNEGQLRISSMNASTALKNHQLALEQFNEAKRQYEEGLADEKALKAAEIKLRNAQAKAQESLDVDRGTDIVYGNDNTAFIVNKKDGSTAPVVGKDGKPLQVRPTGTSQTAAMKNAKYYVDIGLFGSERDAAAAMMGGKSMSRDRRLVEAYKLADGKLSLDPTLMGDAAAQERERLAQEYYSILGGDAAPQAGSSTNAPNIAQPGETPPVEGARKAPDGNWYVPDPNRPGKYLQVE